jgi:molybdenum cofactor cytidylyltransferase
MKFLTVSTNDAEEAILAHTLRLPDLDFFKGRKLSQDDVNKLQSAGVDQITVAKLELTDVLEDDAANRAARRLIGSGVVTKAAHAGRVNICSVVSGLVVLDPQGINALNLIDEAITVATVPLHELVEPGQVIATIKVNPYAVSEEIVTAWEGAAKKIKVQPFRRYRTSLIQTNSARIKEKPDNQSI